jgi:Zn(2)-Cys(6) binuclear cluster domain-containing protein
MTSPASEYRGPQACNTCRKRKKACDKVMPSCGYCAKRGILCSYENSSPTFRGSIGRTRSRRHQTTPRCEPLIRGMLNLQIESIIQSLSLSCHEVSERFFQGFHLLLPVISPKLFYTYGAASSPPPSDFSILLLAMCLITQHHPDDSIYTALRSFCTSASYHLRLNCARPGCASHLCV